MSWDIKPEADSAVVVLDGEMGIQNAGEFHRAVLALAGFGGAVRLDASGSRSVHTSIMQILHALSLAVPDFAVTEASEEFAAIEARVGFSFARSKPTEIPASPSGRA